MHSLPIDNMGVVSLFKKKKGKKKEMLKYLVNLIMGNK